MGAGAVNLHGSTRRHCSNCPPAPPPPTPQVQGGGLRDSFLVDGVAFQKTFSYAGFEMQPKSYEVGGGGGGVCGERV